MMNRELSLEDRCELNKIRHEICRMRSLTDTEKFYAIDSILRNLLDLYDADSVIGSSKYELDLCRKKNAEMQL